MSPDPTNTERQAPHGPPAAHPGTHPTGRECYEIRQAARTLSRHGLQCGDRREGRTTTTTT